jgi:hypothetical protein
MMRRPASKLCSTPKLCLAAELCSMPKLCMEILSNYSINAEEGLKA